MTRVFVNVFIFKIDEKTVFRFLVNLLIKLGGQRQVHRAASKQKWLEDQGVKRFEGWLNNSPDLNPIKNLWLEIKHKQQQERASSIAGLKIACKVWRQVMPEYLNDLYNSMPRQMEAVIQAEGNHNKY